MKGITMLAALAALTATHASAQPSLAEVCQDADMPTRAEYDDDPTAYADNFCALAMYAPNRAARQFDSMVSLVRAHNNPNRHYWDRRYEPTAEYLQLLRPWMAERNMRVVRVPPATTTTTIPLNPWWVPVVVARAGGDGLRQLPDHHYFWLPYLWLGQSHLNIGRTKIYAVMFMSHAVLRAGRYRPLSGLDAFFALITRSGDIERINFMSADVYWHWINDRRNDVDGRDEPNGYNVTRTVHAALDCLGRDGAIANAINLIGAGDYPRNTHYSCEVPAE